MINEWYNSLIKSPLNPPGWVFGPAWTILYILMGISLLMYLKGGQIRTKIGGITVFTFQLILNLNWSRVFFANHDISGAFRIILLLWVLILLNIYLFAKRSKTAAILLIPYLLWVSFATYLNYYIVRYN